MSTRRQQVETYLRNEQAAKANKAARTKRRDELFEEHGCATYCEVPDEPGRYALKQTDAGAGDNGGPWWDFGDDPLEMIRGVLNMEYPEDWPPEVVYDLDTGKSYDIEYEPSLTERT